jgi:hypothetical protein
MSSKSKRPKMHRGPEVRRDRIMAVIEPKPGEDFISAIKRSRQCPDCDSDVEFGPDGLHIIHRPTCPRLRSWQAGHESN